MGSHHIIEKLLEDIQKHEIYDRASSKDIDATEAQLQVKLPKSYLKFVREFSNGAYLYGIQEVSAVGSGNAQIYPIQSNYLYWKETSGDSNIKVSQEEIVTLEQLIPFSLDHNGNAWCFIANEKSEEEYRVGYYSQEHDQLYGVLKDFNEWLTVLVESKEEVIRALYDDEIIVHTLGLG